MGLFLFLLTCIVVFSSPPSKTYQADSESYNGAEREGYSWSQSITDCDLRVQVNTFFLVSLQLTIYN